MSESRGAAGWDWTYLRSHEPTSAASKPHFPSAPVTEVTRLCANESLQHGSRVTLERHTGRILPFTLSFSSYTRRATLRAKQCAMYIATPSWLNLN